MSEQSDIEILDSVYASARMGNQTISDILPKVSDQRMQQVLDGQLHEYKAVESEAVNEIIKRGSQPRDFSLTEKISLWADVKMNTTINRSATHIAEYLILGTTTGMTDVTRRLNRERGASESARRLADRLLNIEQSGINQLREFLS